jgi:cytochrome c biogenesis protein CcdA
MTHILPLLGTYIPIPPSGRLSESTPPWADVMYGLGYITTLVLMYSLVRKALKKRMRRRRKGDGEDVT